MTEEKNWAAKHNGDMLKLDAALMKEWSALPLELKVVVSFLAVVGVLVVAEWRNRYRIEAWYVAHQWELLVTGALVALLASYPIFLLVRRRWRHQRVERHLERIKKLQQSQARVDAGLGFAGSTMTNRLLERERQKLAKRLNQTAPPKEGEEEPADALMEVIPWERPEIHSCMDDVVIGAYRGARPMAINLTPEAGHQLNALVAGQSGYGKTTTVNLLISNYAYCRDAVMGGIDIGGGGFHRWRRLFVDGLYADRADNIDQVLAQLEEELDYRNGILQEYQDRDAEPIWTPSPTTPDLFFFIDEGADLTSEQQDHVFLIARKGRKAGIHIVYCTQRPSASVISSDLRSQLQVRISMRVQVSTDSEIVFGPSSIAAGWRAHEIARGARGVAVMDVPTADVTQEQGRVIRMLPDQVRLVVEDRAGHQPSLRSKPPIPPPVASQVESAPLGGPPLFVVPEGLSELQLKSWARDTTWGLVKTGEVRGRPKLCEADCGTPLTRYDYPHHWDYRDPTRIGWFCRACHEQADRERRKTEGSDEWTDAQVMEAIDRVYKDGWKWDAAAEHYGLTYKALWSRCHRRFPTHPVFRKRGKSGETRRGKVSPRGKGPNRS